MAPRRCDAPATPPGRNSTRRSKNSVTSSTTPHGARERRATLSRRRSTRCPKLRTRSRTKPSTPRQAPRISPTGLRRRRPHRGSRVAGTRPEGCARRRYQRSSSRQASRYSCGGSCGGGDEEARQPLGVLIDVLGGLVANAVFIRVGLGSRSVATAPGISCQCAGSRPDSCVELPRTRSRPRERARVVIVAVIGRPLPWTAM